MTTDSTTTQTDLSPLSHAQLSMKCISKADYRWALADATYGPRKSSTTAATTSAAGSSPFDDDKSLSDFHRQFLRDQAISDEVMDAGEITTMRKALDLPEALRHIGYDPSTLPGIVYWHFRIDGSRMPQYRMDREPSDDETKKEQKYRQPSGTGSVISVHPFMQQRMKRGNWKRLLIVEGTKQYLAAVSACTDNDLLIIGIQGCGNWSKNSVPLPELLRFIEVTDTDGNKAGTVEKVVILFDADVSSNESVWLQAQRLGSYVDDQLGSGKVGYAILRAVGEKAGLDDYLGALPDENRANVITNQIANARKTLPRKPAAKVKAGRVRGLTPVVDIARGRIYEPITADESDIDKAVPLMNAAARITATNVVEDDLNFGVEASITHDLEVYIGREDDEEYEQQVYEITVPDEGLDQPRAWLRKLPEGIGTSIVIASDRSARDAVSNAIRTHDEDSRARYRSLRRTGWAEIDGVHRFLHCGGAIGPNDMITYSKAVLGDYRYLSFPSPPSTESTGSDGASELCRVVQAALSMFDMLVDPTQIYLGMGLMALAATGVPPRANGMLIGPPHHGKTTVAQSIMAHLTPTLGPDVGGVMASAIDSKGSLRDAGAGLHNLMLEIEDIRTLPSHQGNLDMAEAFDTLLHVGYDGPHTRRSRLEFDKLSGKHAKGTTDLAWPATFTTGENLPIELSSVSTAQRVLVLNVNKDTTIGKGKLPELLNLTTSGDLPLAWSGFLQWLAQMIEAEGWDAHRDMIEKCARLTGEMLTREDVGLLIGYPERAVSICARIITGFWYWLEYCQESGAITFDEKIDLYDDCVEKLAAAQKAHWISLTASNVKPDKAIIAELRSAVVGRRACFFVEGNNPPPGVTMIGRRSSYTDQVTKEKVDCVALLVEEAVRVLNGHKGVERIMEELKPSLVPYYEKSSGKMRWKWKQRFSKDDKSTIGCAIIKLSDWLDTGPDGADEDETGHQDPPGPDPYFPEYDGMDGPDEKPDA